MKLAYYITIFVFVLFSCTQNTKRNSSKISRKTFSLNDFTKLGKLHKKLAKPQPGEWLFHQEEKGQSFANYITGTRMCPNDSMNKIVILPMGTFSNIEMQLLKQTANYASIFFMMDIELLGAVSDNVVPPKSRRTNYYGEQLHTQYILKNILLENIPDSAISFIAITNKDLYPQDDWNFVFGQASLKKRIGVSSYRRYYDNNLDTANFDICWERIIKTTTHELCHMFSLKHCSIYKCLLNGSNSMNEADEKPLWLCPECLAKLQNCLKFDLFKRYDRLMEFFSKYQMAPEIEYYRKSKQLMIEQNI